MAMDFLGKEKRGYKKQPLLKLIQQGVVLNAYDGRWGWIHDGLVRLAKENGFKKSFRKEWPHEALQNKTKTKTILRYIVVLLRRGVPVLASVKSETGGHLVLLVGCSDDGFLYHDPDARVRTEGKFKFIAIEPFLEIWKGRIIVVK